MIRLFRKIRQELLGEESYFTYLLYASGEILLVIIGILLALQIDNWNDKRKENKERTLLVDALIHDLAMDTVLLNNYIESCRVDLEMETNLHNRMYSDDATLDTIKKIALTEFFPNVPILREFHNTTYTSLVSTGQIQLFQGILGTALINHYLMQENLINSNVATTFSNKIDDYTKQYDVMQPQGESFMSEMAWDIPDERAFVMSFTDLVGYSRMADQQLMNRYNQMLRSTKDLMQLLEDYRQ